MENLSLKIKMIEMLIEAEQDDKILCIRHFTEKLNADEKEVKKIILELKNSKAIQTEYGVNDDGMLAGRGYVLTYEITRWSIREWLQELKNLSVSPNERKGV